MKLIGRPKATVGLYSYGWMATEAEAALEMEDLLHSFVPPQLRFFGIC
jgi:hypothetical protein